MRLLFLLMGCCLAINGMAQAPQQKLRIQVTYEKAGQYLEQAVETIEAINIVGKAAHVEYQAGQSVTMLPGFEAKNGSTFVAHIKNVEINSESALQLTAYPNPFQQSTTIKYYLPDDGIVNLWVIDTQGKIIGQLVKSENQSAGQHSLEWTPSALSDGIYIPIIESNQKKAVTRIVKK